MSPVAHTIDSSIIGDECPLGMYPSQTQSTQKHAISIALSIVRKVIEVARFFKKLHLM
jgi:hypothetical protein